MIADNITYEYPLFNGTSKSDYLPKWAVDEGIYNCEHSWKRFRLEFFINKVLTLWD